MSKYLYGASVQGIQSFIFQTNKLQEIVGASELVEEICTTKFWEVAGINKDDPNIILNAAGNIKCIFEDEEKCKAFVRIFPKEVMEMAPGITISQAVVKIKEDQDNNQLLEKRLRIQRNKAISIFDGVGLMVTETARKTGGVGVEYINNDVIDEAQRKKIIASKPANRYLLEKLVGKHEKLIERFPFDISDLAKDTEKSWIAVIHADGNNLGKKIVKMVLEVEQNRAFDLIKNFSKTLGEVTETAAKNAFQQTIPQKGKDDEKNFKYPFRPVVLGGDDFTAIVRADLALNYAEAFLSEFERLSKELFKEFGAKNKLENNPFENGLTACAGVSFIKANYPFHYGVTLAENLCGEAKKVSKTMNEDHSPSSIVFHKVHSSFVEEYEDIIEKELKAKNDVRFNYGPYFIHNQFGYSTVKDLKARIRNINRKTAPKSGVRKWLTELRNNPETAMQLLNRLVELKDGYKDRELLRNPFTQRSIKEDGEIKELKFTPFFDIISLSKIQKPE